jgi:proteasome alpha subunit
MGGSAERPTSYLQEHYRAGADLEAAIRVAVEALGQGESETRQVPASNLEVAVLDRTRSQQRKFRRLRGAELGRILGNGTADSEPPAGVSTGPTLPDPGEGEGDPPVAPPVA